MLPAFEVLQNRDFRLLWFGAMGSVLGSTMLALTRGYIAYDLTGSAAALGFVTLAQGVPMLILSMLGGVVADRVRKRPLLLLSQGSLAVTGLICAVLVHAGVVEIWHLALLSVAQGVIFSFNQPSRQAYMIELVGNQQIARAVGLNNASATFMSIVGPAAAGFLIAVPAIGTTYTLYLISLVYLLPVAMLLIIRTESPARRSEQTGFADQFVEGLRYISGHAVLRMIVLAGVVAMLVGSPYAQLLPVFASDEVLDVGASGLGLMSTAVGLGAFVGAIGVASWGSPRQQALMQLRSGIAFGLALAAFSYASYFPLALLMLVLVGLSSSAFATLNSTLSIGASEPAYYGRVSSVQQLNWSLSNLAVLPLGIAVDAAGAPLILLAAGCLLAGFFLLLGVLSPSFRQPRSNDPVVVHGRSEDLNQRVDEPIA